MSDYINDVTLLSELRGVEQRVADLETKVASQRFTIWMLIACALLSAVSGILQAFQIL